MYAGLHVRYPLFFSDFKVPGVYWLNFQKIFQYQISCGSPIMSQVVPFREADGRTDEQKHALRSFSKFF